MKEKDKIEDIFNPDSKFITHGLGEHSLKDLKDGEIIQIERRGFYRVDKINAIENVDDFSCNLQLIKIPDGKSSNMSTIGSKVDPKLIAKGTTEESSKPKQEKKEKAEKTDKGDPEKKREAKEKKEKLQKEGKEGKEENECKGQKAWKECKEGKDKGCSEDKEKCEGPKEKQQITI